MDAYDNLCAELRYRGVPAGTVLLTIEYWKRDGSPPQKLLHWVAELPGRRRSTFDEGVFWSTDTALHELRRNSIRLNGVLYDVKVLSGDEADERRRELSR